MSEVADDMEIGSLATSLVGIKFSYGVFNILNFELVYNLHI